MAFRRLSTLVALGDKLSIHAAKNAFTGCEAIGIAACSALLFVFVGSLLFPYGNTGIVSTQLIAFALPALFVARTKQSPTTSMGLVRAPFLLIVGTIVIGSTLWYWNVHWIAPISASWSPPQHLAQWSDRVSADTRPIYESLLVFALVPAVCEEFLHRGVIAPALAKRFGTDVAIFLSALLFGLSHLSLARLLPTALLGGFAAFLRLRSGSLWPAILVHLLSNSFLLIAAEQRWSLPSSLAVPLALLTLLGISVSLANRPT